MKRSKTQDGQVHAPMQHPRRQVRQVPRYTIKVHYELPRLSLRKKLRAKKGCFVGARKLLMAISQYLA